MRRTSSVAEKRRCSYGPLALSSDGRPLKISSAAFSLYYMERTDNLILEDIEDRSSTAPNLPNFLLTISSVTTLSRAKTFSFMIVTLIAFSR
jgi:hypothetical protein